MANAVPKVPFYDPAYYPVPEPDDEVPFYDISAYSSDYDPEQYQDPDQDLDPDLDQDQELDDEVPFYDIFAYSSDYDPKQYKDPDLDEEEEKQEEKQEEKPEPLWTDLLHVLYDGGFLFLGREIKAELANTLISLIIHLDLKPKSPSIQTMFINSPGGFVLSGMAIFDAMLYLNGNIDTICVGTAASMATVVMLAGKQRIALRHSGLLIHQPSMKEFEDETYEVVIEAHTLADLRHDITRIYVRYTHKPYWVIMSDLETDTFMSAHEAYLYGLVDGVSV
uniref:ATP-dependent Clp protease proteolytic subunit n=1 Tax=Geranium maderense TaxID=28964 RepID=A0A165TUA2_9ROSI|nr:ATP-dependent Clp protease proteolytic subunit [Geranium maderense]AMY96046.1 ATP-dependent Clp protease proteolytic subunit [Geranium maderense]